MDRSYKKNLFVLALTAMLGIAHVPQAMALSDEIIKQRIQGAAADISDLRGTKVDVAVEEGYVVLYGRVHLYSQKMEYERIAWRTMGVSEVDNEISVVPQFPMADAAIKRKIRGIVKTYQRFHGAEVKIRVEKGSVFLRATLEHPRDVFFLKHRVAEIEGVITIEIETSFRV